jgi:DNA-binding NtrC family response regulator
MSRPEPSSQPVILVIDEEDQIRNAVCEHLARHGFGTLDAVDSDAALSLLRRHPEIKGVVVDATLPGSLDGAELIRRMRKERPQLAGIMTSGHSDEVSGEVPDGCEFLNKPSLPEELVPMLRRLLHMDGSPD